ncbi:cell division protein FtsQ/DivIB [Amycolatopsis anabasis]|uniref:cell division protein FtsQ/DivIB n=1 Tax=Amycolatopsis anabasis TaxID=1840409 RepID=UPI00131CBC2E|nr:FtsQ-type POTRA domain-containing protein [Amycolatopsis anabasis]
MRATRERTGERSRPGDENRRRPAPNSAGRRRGRRPQSARQKTGTRPTRQRALRRRWVALLSVVTVAAVVYLLFFTSLLGVRSVEVLGANSVSADQVRAVAAVPDRRAMLRVDTAEIRDRVAAMPGVATAEVSRSWPSTIEIEITERTAMGYFERDGGIHLVDGTGVDFKTVKEKPGGLPQLKLARVAPDDAPTRAVTAVLAAVPEQLRSQVTAAGAVTPGSVELTLANGKVVRWGDAEQTERKAKVLAALLTREGKTYDVSSPELPTVS